MISKINTATLTGLESDIVTVETCLTNQLPGISITGLASQTIQESRERVRVAIAASGFRFPHKKVTINLAPAWSRKEGSHFDLPMAIGILAASGELKEQQYTDYAFIGELSLDGSINSVTGALPLIIGLRDGGIKKIILPKGNAEEASIVRDVILYAADSLKQAIELLQGADSKPYNSCVKYRYGSSDGTNGLYEDVVGQESAKRAITICVAGGHGIFMMGFPGSGKTMLAQRIPSIMPEMTYEEMLEATKVYSVAGELSNIRPMIIQRPFRTPHHTISPAALLGGGGIPKPGEISLAHHGVLFLDEFPEFSRQVLEMLRQPLEERKINIARAAHKVTFPSSIMLVAASNPCKCGFYGDDSHQCTCTTAQLNQYRSKISGPILDRIDLQIEIPPVKYKELLEEDNIPGKSSASMREAVKRARKIQRERYINEGISLNSELNAAQLREYCILDTDCKALLREGIEKLGLSARAFSKVVKVARTIADIDEDTSIRMHHIAEAMRYRSLDKFYRNL